MLRRFCSKRSGFTLAEILIAFVIFAIMSTMIAQILDLAVKQRGSNNLYANELARQMHMLTLIEKDSGDFDATQTTGSYSIEFPTDTITLPYQIKPADPTAVNAAEGLNYFLSPVNYLSDGETPPGGTDPSGSTNSGSQASRMDTRLTGTAGIGDITVYRVIKDTNTYAADSPFYLPAGHTRYYIEVSASSVSGGKTTLKDEDVPYAQYRMYFYGDTLDAGSATEYTDASGKTYTKDVYKAASIVKVGYLNTSFTASNIPALTTSNTSNEVNSNNVYTIEKQSANTVRIGTPFVTDTSTWPNKKGIRFNGGKFSRFYIEFDGDPNLTTASFGHNGVAETNADGTPRTMYTACPVYEDKYNSDGTPTYDETGKNHVNIYGASLYTRHYK